MTDAHGPTRDADATGPNRDADATGPNRDADADDPKRDPDRLLGRAGVAPDTDRDQHFLVDDRILDRIPGYLPEDADVGHVLEIGAGTGALTDRLLATADQVTAVERDETLVEFLHEEFAPEIAAGRLTIVGGDATSVDLPEFDASVSNLPYGASSPILFRLLPRGKPLVVLVQREFAERMAADPGTPEYGRLSVSAGHYAAVRLVEPVPKEAFDPPPAVESMVVQTTPRDPSYVVADEAFFLRFVKALFTQRRKTIRNGIRNTAHISGLDSPDDVVAATPDALLQKRPDATTPAEFAQLAAIATDHGL